MQRLMTWLVILVTFGMVAGGTGRSRSKPAGTDGVHALDGSGGGPPPTM
jgi:hypothetical protein